MLVGVRGCNKVWPDRGGVIPVWPLIPSRGPQQTPVRIAPITKLMLRIAHALRAKPRQQGIFNEVVWGHFIFYIHRAGAMVFPA